MLSYPERHKFEEIRSRWEFFSDGTQANMVGRREKPNLLDGDDTANSSKFRRKLSYGLSLISLSQRRTMPARPSLPSNDLTTAIDIPDPRPHETTRLLSPMHDLSSYGTPAVRKVTPNNKVSPRASLDLDATPKQLPRSRTMTFIPRPSRRVSEESGSAPTPGPSPFMLEDEAHATPTKIPSPDPSAPAHRNVSPRQYRPLASLTSQQAKQAAAGTVRSYTTPNLVKRAYSSGSTTFMAPRMSGQQRLTSIPVTQRPNMKENASPVTHRHVKRLSNIQEHSPSSPRRESAMAPTAASKRKSVDPASVLAQSKQGPRNTPPGSSKPRTTHALSQTPLTAQRALPKNRSPLHTTGSVPASSGSAVAQTRLLGPVSPLTSATNGNASARGSLPRSSTEKDFRKRTFSTPYRKMGGAMAARAQVGVNNEVRLPRSSTHHHLLARFEEVPPVPAIPEQYKSASMPLLVSTQGAMESARPGEEPSGQDSDVEMISLPSSKSSLVDLPSMPEVGDYQKTNTTDGIPQSRKSMLPKSKSKLSIQIPGPGRTFSASMLFSAKPSELWSAKTPKAVGIANVGVSRQVKEYMPAMYWAGRFQSRFDQWRTEAMHAELDPSYIVEGPLAHCNVHQESKAACHIFLQLRELCSSYQAADSLWEFEHKYRQDHRLLNISLDLPPLNPRPEESYSKGSFGRAIRKMTPRKSSFVNLLKGKGWNTDESKSTDGPADYDLTLTKSFDSYEDCQ
ncbi:hypothetical protein BU23DRAFT_449613 [Bimuria novae-zelandiae CBS 107.79]|uniref:Uncharacterized protein n=1 Tax=Bimuria novae-zelandiae CBS 107.79 TaxID=1447943 RepID=A0A6A5VM24_9PLEO|nr:hypothetical protein BU23DRAFT_449613 [Bimuria novae-zelandiae CBS 107.79]